MKVADIFFRFRRPRSKSVFATKLQHHVGDEYPLLKKPLTNRLNLSWNLRPTEEEKKIEPERTRLQLFWICEDT